jgi:DNA invertase Pin-like site-specific DNA recombinase
MLVTVYGFARASTDDQTLELLRSELQASGCRKLFCQKVSGAGSDRPQLAKLLKAFKAGDCLVVTKLERLARSTRDLQTIPKAVRTAHADFRVLDTPSLDTTSPYRKLLFDILAALAELERKFNQDQNRSGKKSR